MNCNIQFLYDVTDASFACRLLLYGVIKLNIPLLWSEIPPMLLFCEV